MTDLPRGFFNREMSWLEFNGRVLEEAREVANPLLERLRFFCIFHGNLDEFFMVRVASLMHSIREGNTKPDDAGMAPFEQLDRIMARVRTFEGTAAELWPQLVSALETERIRIQRPEEVGGSAGRYLDEYFDGEIYPVLTPLAIDPAGAFPRLSGLSINLAVLLTPEKDGSGETRLAVVQVPGRMPGLCRLPDKNGIRAVWLQDVIRRRLRQVFSGYRIVEAAGFRLTRDSELELDDEGRYDYVRMLESELKRRRLAEPVRLEHEAGMSAELLMRVREGLGVTDSSLISVRRPLDPRPLLTLVDMPGFERLRYPPQPPVLPSAFARDKSIFDIIREQDVLLHHPYESFEPMVELIRAAAEDPDVLAIKQTLYRAGGPGSPILDALVEAAENGKQVTVLVELTARFDEAPNITRARDLEAAGAHVLYGIAGLKVHAKIALVVRREPGGIRRYVHLSTGNYNERTARVYTDMGLLTATDDFGSDASGFFNTITGYSEPPAFNRLVMAPLGMRDRIISLIRREADWARSGQNAGITAKMNSLVDSSIIQELYAASAAGVSIRLAVRGICCLVPGLPGVSENIRVISIVDRYLEHSRAFAFRNGGNPEVYLSSADWMPRNLDRRVELMFPLVDPRISTRVAAALESQFADNVKARQLNPNGSYEHVKSDPSERLQAQTYTYARVKEENERDLSVTPARLVPIEKTTKS
jgi:polyphosphate kinase